MLFVYIALLMFFIQNWLIKTNVERFNCFFTFFQIFNSKMFKFHHIFKGNKGVGRENPSSRLGVVVVTRFFKQGDWLKDGQGGFIRSRDGFCKELNGWAGV